MKKILLILTIIFFVTGCYDNIELDDLAIVSGVGIDYKDNNFHLTYEILSDVKTEENTALLSYTVKGSGKTISEAFINTNYKVSKKAYFAHLKVLVLSEEVINGHFDKITDYILRDTNLRSDFKVLVANNTTPDEILKSNDYLYDGGKFNRKLMKELDVSMVGFARAVEECGGAPVEYNAPSIKKWESRQNAKEALKPKCPHCHSTNIAKISTTERAVSVLGLGVLSKKINKSFKHCF